jgi:hypothetical protein
MTSDATPPHELNSDLTCTCRSTLIDWVWRTAGHPYTDCPLYGTKTRLPAGSSGTETTP